MVSFALLAVLAAAPAAPAPGSPPAPAAPPHVRFFPRADVRLLPGPFRDAQLRGLEALLRLDPERLLHTFRLNAGLPSTTKPYGGWEKPDVELRGHTLGHYLSACALLHEATGDPRPRARALTVVRELARVQAALAARGATPGYLSAFPESFFDRVEARQPVWAPYYTLHKILAGLLDVHRTTGDVQALEVASRMADWVGARAAKLDDARWQAMLSSEFGGMQESLAALYAVTSNPEHLRLARLFDHREVFDPLARGEDALDGLHANTQIPKAIGAALDCELTGSPRYCAVARTFWERVAQHRSYAIGGHSEDEHFSPTRVFSRHLGESTAETCNTYNMLKLTRQLFGLRPEPGQMDFYERALLNHVLASQDPATGAVTYYVSLRPGTFRTYSSAEESFWCCVGTGLENPGRYAEAAYAHEGETLLVNLFLASELRWPAKGLQLRQETSFPDEPRTRLLLRLERPLRFALRIRRPAWAGEGFAVKVNGQPAGAGEPGPSLTIEREWRTGDRVDVELPMRLRFEPMPDDTGVAALVYGPVVLAADLGAEGLDASRRYGPSAPEAPLSESPAVPALVAANEQDALGRVKPAGGPLEFRTEGLGRPADVRLKPFFRLADRRYTVYFHRLTEQAWAARQAAAARAAEQEQVLARRTVDRVLCGDEASEAAHAVEPGSAPDSGWFEGRRYRATRARSGPFGYSLAVPEKGAVVLRADYWGGEVRRRCFDVLVEGEPIARQELFDDRPGEVHAVEYEVPERLVRGRGRLRVALRPCEGSSTGAVFALRTLRAAD